MQQTSFEVNCDTLSESLVSGMVATAHISSLCLRIIIKLSRILKVLENIFRVKVQLETDILTLATFKCETQMECQPLWKIDCMDIYRNVRRKSSLIYIREVSIYAQTLLFQKPTSFITSTSHTYTPRMTLRYTQSNNGHLTMTTHSVEVTKIYSSNRFIVPRNFMHKSENESESGLFTKSLNIN